MAQNAPVLTRRPESRAGDVDRMRQRVDDLRAAMGRDVHEFRGRLRQAFDLRRQTAKHPFVAVAVVLGGVFLAATIVRLLRGARTTGTKGPRQERAAESCDVAHGPAGGPRTRDGRPKEAPG